MRKIPFTFSLAVMPICSARSTRIFRYLLTGGVAWLADIAVFAASLDTVGIVMAQLAARIVGAVVAFLGHKLFVFREPSVQASALARQSVLYAALWALSYAVSTLALIGLIEHGGMNAITAKVMVEAAIVVMNYLVMKVLIFQPRAKGIGE